MSGKHNLVTIGKHIRRHYSGFGGAGLGTTERATTIHATTSHLEILNCATGVVGSTSDIPT